MTCGKRPFPLARKHVTDLLPRVLVWWHLHIPSLFASKGSSPTAHQHRQLAGICFCADPKQFHRHLGQVQAVSWSWLKTAGGVTPQALMSPRNKPHLDESGTQLLEASTGIPAIVELCTSLCPHLLRICGIKSQGFVYNSHPNQAITLLT